MIKSFFRSLKIISYISVILFFYLLYLSRDLPSLERLETFDPAMLSTIYDRNGEVIGEFYIQKRDEKSMLGGLWEFPGGKVKNKESFEQALEREIKEECGIIPIIKSKIGCVDHSYSHFSISLNSFHCIEGNEKIRFSKNGVWITHKEISLYPFPKANHKLFTLINKTGWNV